MNTEKKKPTSARELLAGAYKDVTAPSGMVYTIRRLAAIDFLSVSGALPSGDAFTSDGATMDPERLMAQVEAMPITEQVAMYQAFIRIGVVSMKVVDEPPSDIENGIVYIGDIPQEDQDFLIDAINDHTGANLKGAGVDLPRFRQGEHQAGPSDVEGVRDDAERSTE